MRPSLNDTSLDVWFNGGYVDDLKYLVSLLDSGWRWSNEANEFVWSSEDEEDDSAEEKDILNSGWKWSDNAREFVWDSDSDDEQSSPTPETICPPTSCQIDDEDLKLDELMTDCHTATGVA